MSIILKTKVFDFDKKNNSCKKRVARSPIRLGICNKLSTLKIKTSGERESQACSKKHSSPLKNFGLEVSDDKKNLKLSLCEFKEISPAKNEARSRRSNRYFKNSWESRPNKEKFSADIKNYLAQSFIEIIQKRNKSHRSIVNEVSTKNPMNYMDLFNKTWNTQKYLKDYFSRKSSSSYATPRRNTKCFESIEYSQNCVSIQTDDLMP